VLLELRDDMIGDSEPLLLRQPGLETADDLASTQQGIGNGVVEYVPFRE
jgi:hypothetical protein